MMEQQKEFLAYVYKEFTDSARIESGIASEFMSYVSENQNSEN